MEGEEGKCCAWLVGWTDEHTENISPDCIYEWRQTENRNTHIKQKL